MLRLGTLELPNPEPGDVYIHDILTYSGKSFTGAEIRKRPPEWATIDEINLSCFIKCNIATVVSNLYNIQGQENVELETEHNGSWTGVLESFSVGYEDRTSGTITLNFKGKR